MSLGRIKETTAPATGRRSSSNTETLIGTEAAPSQMSVPFRKRRIAIAEIGMATTAISRAFFIFLSRTVTIFHSGITPPAVHGPAEPVRRNAGADGGRRTGVDCSDRRKPPSSPFHRGRRAAKRPGGLGSLPVPRRSGPSCLRVSPDPRPLPIRAGGIENEGDRRYGWTPLPP